MHKSEITKNVKHRIYSANVNTSVLVTLINVITNA